MTDAVTTTAAPAGEPAAPASTAALLNTPPAAAAGGVPDQIAAAADAAQGKVAAGAGIDWLPGANEELVGYVKNKGWTDPKQVLEGYQNLEKMRGVPAERLLTLPAADADQAAKDAFYEKLGRPKDASGYEFSLGENDPFDAGLKQTFHKHGLSAEQAKGVIADYAEIAKAEQAKAQQQTIEKIGAEHQELLREWGAAASQNLGLAGKGKEILGWSDEVVDAVGAAVGHKNTIKMLADIAARAGEAPLVTDASAQGYGQAMTPAQATARLKELAADRDWVKRLQAGGPDSKEAKERRRLIEFQVAGR